MSFLLALILVGCSSPPRPSPPPETPPETQPPPPVSRTTTPPVSKTVPKPRGPIIDSALSREEAVGDNRFPDRYREAMAVVDVTYWGFDSMTHRGQIVVHQDLANEVREIFAEIYAAKWPIARMVPIVKHEWDDDASMAANNTSGFNYRTKNGGGTLSMHAFGRAIDLNPFQNPYLNSDGRGVSAYDPRAKGTITVGSPPYRAFRKRRWIWGGHWAGAKDYQHFEKGPAKL